MYNEFNCHIGLLTVFVQLSVACFKVLIALTFAILFKIGIKNFLLKFTLQVLATMDLDTVDLAEFTKERRRHSIALFCASLSSI